MVLLGLNWTRWKLYTLSLSPKQRPMFTHSLVSLGIIDDSYLITLATIALPLTDLTRKTTPNQVRWDQQCDQAFKRLKELLCSSPILQSPDFSRPFILQIDVSDQGVGAVLTQRDKNGLEHPVS